MSEYESVIGLEVHCQLGTKTKLFCGCAAEFGAAPNQNTCPVCMAFPGALPVLNHQAYLFGIRVGLALDCAIAEILKFDRKNYFYPDLPKGYQISQFDMPICGVGHLMIDLEEGQKRIGITRAHLEEDAGKLLHDQGEGSVVDYNRACVPLIEIVSEPDLRSPDEAHAYLTTLKAVLQYSGVSDCDMEKGSLRCDANVSVRKKGDPEFGTRVEIKNLNSFSAVKRAIQYEINRQIAAVEEGETVHQETRLWNDENSVTRIMRSKEEAHDYRYFPEPDLVPFTVSAELVAELRAQMPELPRARKERYVSEFGLSEYDAHVLTLDQQLGNYYEEVLKLGADPKSASNWLMTEIMGQLNEQGQTLASAGVTPAHVAELLALIAKGTISGKIGKEVVAEMISGGKMPEAIVKEKGLVQVSDESEIIKIIEKVIEANPKPVADFKNGKEQSFGFLVGQVMRETKGKANPAVANRVLRELLTK